MKFNFQIPFIAENVQSMNLLFIHPPSFLLLLNGNEVGEKFVCIKEPR